MEQEKKLVKVKLVKHEWPDEKAKRHKKNLKRVGFVVLLVCIFFSGSIFGSMISSDGETNTNKKLNAVLNIMENNWFFGKDVENLSNQLIDDALVGITSQESDPHTQYMDSEYAKSFFGSIEGKVVGIGVQYSTATADNIILKVFQNSPAYEAGIHEGDIIRKVDGILVEEIEDLSKAVVGEEGSEVVITVQRGNEYLDLTCTRKSVDTSVNGYIQGDVGILELLSVSENSAFGVYEVLDEFSRSGIKKIIVDVRGNTGGYLTTIVDVASYFLPKDSVVLQEKDKNGNVVEDKTSKTIEPYTFEKVAVLIDGNSASAAEVLAIALKEQIGATLIGDQSYGKGTIQTTQPFSDGSMLKYTKAIWLSPKGNWIDGVGIEPDILVKTPNALLMGTPTEFEPIHVDEVGAAVASMQVFLDYLGYDVDRQDGYFSNQSLEALHAFNREMKMEVNDELDKDELTSIMAKVIYESRVNKSRDVQMLRALEEMK